jgi:hypothetical protein
MIVTDKADDPRFVIIFEYTNFLPNAGWEGGKQSGRVACPILASEAVKKLGLWRGSSETRRVDFGHFTGTEARVPVARAEGPAVSSHARQGVACGRDDMEVRRTGTKPVS